MDQNSSHTTAEIVKALRCDGKDPDCNGCMFENGCYVEDQMRVAADRLEQLEAQNAETDKRIVELERENEALKDANADQMDKLRQAACLVRRKEDSRAD